MLEASSDAAPYADESFRAVNSRPSPARLTLGLGKDDNGRYRRENHTANGEKGDRSRGERRGLAALERPSKRAMATGSDDEQGEREHRVAAPEHDVWRCGGVQ